MGINRSRGPEERVRVGGAEHKQPQVVQKHSAGMLVKEGLLCVSGFKGKRKGW